MNRFVNLAFDYVDKNKRDYIYGDNRFIRHKYWSFLDYVKHIIFRNKTTLRHSINSMYKILHGYGFKKITASAFCQQRKFIKAEVFKEINKCFLKNIGITDDKKILKTFKGFRVFAGDGSDLEDT